MQSGISYVRRVAKTLLSAPLPTRIRQSEKQAERFIALQLVLLAVSLATLYALNSYWGYDTATLIFRGDDGWCDYNTEGFGYHCFGDYHQFVNISDQEYLIDWNGQAIPNTSQGRFPIGSIIFDSFSILGSVVGSRFALAIWLSASVLFILTPIIVATRRMQTPVKISSIVTLGILTLPFLAIIDRGQIQSLIVPFLFIFAIALISRRYSVVALSASVLFLIKPQFAVLVLALSSRAAWKYIPWWLITTLIGLVLSFLPYGSQALERVDFWINSLLNAPAADINGKALWVADYSFSATIQNLGLTINNVSEPLGNWMAANSLGLSVTFTAVSLAGLILLRSRIPEKDLVISWLVLASLAIPSAPTYYLAFALVIVSLIIGDYFTRPSSEKLSADCKASRPLPDLLLVAAIGLSLSPMIIMLEPPEIQYPWSSISQRGMDLENFVPVVVTALWMVIIIRALLRGLRTRWLGNENSKVLDTIGGYGRVVMALGLVFIGGFLIIKSTFVAADSERLIWYGQEAIPVSYETVGYDTGRSIEFWPSMYKSSGPEAIIFFPSALTSESQCLGGSVKFDWESVTISLNAEDNALGPLEHSFYHLGTEDTRLVISENGSISWITRDGAQEAALDRPVCLNISDADLATNYENFFSLVAREGGQGTTAARSFGAILLSAGVLLLSAPTIWGFRERRAERKVV